MKPVSRRTVLLGGAALATPLAGCGTDGAPGATTEGPHDGGGSPTDDSEGRDGGTPTAEQDGDGLGAEVVAAGLSAPLAVEVPEPGHYLIADQRGRIYLTDGDDTRVYLDLRDRLAADLEPEMGLIGLALHPEFRANGKFYVRYSADRRPGKPEEISHTFVLAEFETDPDADTADASTERRILEIDQPQVNHNSGNIEFGPDGHLYVGVGDGGWAGDNGPGHVQDWYDGVGGGNGQDVTENLLGSVLRIDVDERAGQRPYGVPDDNPLVGAAGFDEHFAWGFRNPWGMSFGPEGRFFVADVGQDAREEVNVVERGGNYGWNVREGTQCYNAQECPAESPDGNSLRDPLIEYGHEDAAVSGNAIVGGYRYDGSEVSDFDGEYVFADFHAGTQVFVATPAESGLWPTRAVTVDHPDFGPQVRGFGLDSDGEILVCCVGDEGRVLRLTRG